MQLFKVHLKSKSFARAIKTLKVAIGVDPSYVNVRQTWNATVIYNSLCIEIDCKLELDPLSKDVVTYRGMCN